MPLKIQTRCILGSETDLTLKGDTDLTDDRQIHGNWRDSSRRCAHPILQEPQLRDLMKLAPMNRVNCCAQFSHSLATGFSYWTQYYRSFGTQ